MRRGPSTGSCGGSFPRRRPSAGPSLWTGQVRIRAVWFVWACPFRSDQRGCRKDQLSGVETGTRPGEERSRAVLARAVNAEPWERGSRCQGW
jgi:hypothetical protein